MDLRHFTASGQPPANPRIHHSKRPALACSLALQSLSSAQKPCQRRDKKLKSARSDFSSCKASLERTIIDPIKILYSRGRWDGAGYNYSCDHCSPKGGIFDLFVALRVRTVKLIISGYRDG